MLPGRVVFLLFLPNPFEKHNRPTPETTLPYHDGYGSTLFHPIPVTSLIAALYACKLSPFFHLASSFTLIGSSCGGRQQRCWRPSHPLFDSRRTRCRRPPHTRLTVFKPAAFKCKRIKIMQSFMKQKATMSLP